jgi:hypothetical protein
VTQASQLAMNNILQNESEYITQLAALTSSLNVSLFLGQSSENLLLNG